jgi:hypothetical protein
MRLLSFVRINILSVSFAATAQAELCSPVSITVPISVGEGRVEGESSLVLFEQALEDGDYDRAAAELAIVRQQRTVVKNRAEKAAQKMCNKNIWQAFNDLVAQPDLCQQFNQGRLGCRMVGESLVYSPRPTAIKCRDSSPGEVEIDYGQDEIDGSTVEYLLATSFAKPSVDSITMSYNCVPDEAGQHSNRR